MVCITFGQPLLGIPLLQEVAGKIPQFESIIHSVFDKEDVMPQLLHYFNFGDITYHGNTVAIKALTSSNGVSSTKGEKPAVSDSKPKKVSLSSKKKKHAFEYLLTCCVCVCFCFFFLIFL